jgi:8-oxo-dGTP pyrophosphatase MutT (NUDIX family)
LANVAHSFKGRLFWIVARTCFALYRTCPLFGTLRASIGIIQRGNKFLVIERNDGRGLSLAGGMSRWREAEDETLRREILEETGLTVTSQELVLKYSSHAELPCVISAYAVETSGDPKDSWEGSVRWVTLDELLSHMIGSQHPVLEVLKKMAASSGVGRQ